MVWHWTTWPVFVCALQRSMVFLGCDHLMTINCSSHGHVQLLFGPCAFNTSGPASWNALPAALRDPAVTFRQMLKSFLFWLTDVYRPWYSCHITRPLWRLLRGVWNAYHYYYIVIIVAVQKILCLGFLNCVKAWSEVIAMSIHREGHVKWHPFRWSC